MKLEVQIRETLRRQEGTRDEVHRFKKRKRSKPRSSERKVKS